MSGPINLGNSHESTILQLAEQILAVCDLRPVLAFKPLPDDDPVRRQPDIALARELLNWSPEVDLAQALVATAAYFRARLASSSAAPLPPAAG